MAKRFVNLHTHSHYSILEGAMSPKALLEYASQLKCPAVALTDTGVGHGLVNFYEQSKNFSETKPILGAEVYVSKDSRFEQRAGIDGKEGKLVLLAQNTEGWHNLVKILSVGSLEGLYEHPRVDWEVLEQHKEGLIALTGSVDGLVGKTFHERGVDMAARLFTKIKDVFGENAYLELVARKGDRFESFNKFILSLHESNDSKVVVCSNARYVNKEDEEAAETLYCIGKNLLIDAPGRVKFAENNWFKSWEEMEQSLSYIDNEILEQARQNSLDIADCVSFELEFGKDLLPEFKVDPGNTARTQLRKNCETEIPIFFPETKTDPAFQKTIQDRLDYELSIIGKMGFEAYFLIVQDFIQFARDNDIAVGPGRGSAAGSIVSYLLGITTIDPIKYELLFERFLNPERISMPDIDIDFSDERRDEVLDYVIKKYGQERVSKVCTFGTLSAKAALKDVGRAQGVPFGDMNALTKLLPNTPGFKLAEAMKVTDFKTKIQSNPAFKKVYDVALKLEGAVRHVSVHACAVIIGKEDLSNEVPLQWAPGTDNVKITQIPYQQLEHIGLLKMDFLGLKNLSVLEKALANIQTTEKVALDLATIPIDDEKTFAMMAKGETTGVFQFESDGMRRYLRELKPTELEDLVAMNALYRPGPMEYIPTYIKGKHKPKSVKYMHSVLEPLLNKTYGIAVYQEQILRIAQDFAGFSLGQADILRKAIGKKIASILNEQRQKFIDGAIAKGHDESMAVKIFDDIIVPFSGYGFNRSHAVCYARIAYETAYLRANYPVEFMAAMMTMDRNNTDRIVLEMNECNTMGIEVLPPSVNESGSYFSIITEAEEKKIRFGLTAIKGLGEDTVDIIIAERDTNGAFTSLQNFAERIPQKLMNKKTLEALGFSGALDEFGNRGAIVDSIEDLAKFAKEFQEKRDGGQMGLFGAAAESVEFHLRDVQASEKDILNWERESLGLFVSDHPLRGMDDYFTKFGVLISSLLVVPEEELEEKAEEEKKEKKPKKKKKRRDVKIHGIVTAVRKIFTKTGKNMAILTLEDTTGKIDCAVFPQAYEKINSAAFEIDAFLCLHGKAEERDGKMNIITDKIKIGDLDKVKAIHKSGEEVVFCEEPLKPANNIPPKIVKTPKDEFIEEYVIIVPAGTTKEKVAAIKQLLIQNKTQKTGTKVFVQIEGRKVEVPFRINYSLDLVVQINTQLKGEDELVF